jgi:hypothetical protein
VVAALLRKALLARATGQSTFEVWGDGSATRDFVYVEDVASTIALLATDHHPSHAGHTFNLASGQETSMRQLAWTIAGVIGGVKPDFNIDAPVGYSNRVMSIRAATETLGYEPKITLEHGLRATVSWVEESGLLKTWLADASAEAPATLSMPTRPIIRKTHTPPDRPTEPPCHLLELRGSQNTCRKGYQERSLFLLFPACASDGWHFPKPARLKVSIPFCQAKYSFIPSVYSLCYFAVTRHPRSPAPTAR